MLRFLCTLVLTAASLTVLAAEPELKERTWTVEGTERTALVWVPTAALKMDSPVIFAFHGHGGTARHAARTFAYQTHWPEAIVVYPQGLNTPGRLTDPEGKRPGWQKGPGDQQDRDLKFFDAILASLKSDYKVDTRRIYATGHSNGGSFTYLLWGSRGEVFAAMAPSAAVPGRTLLEMKPKPVLHVAGTNDPLVKWEWQQLTLEALKRLNGCDEAGTPWHKAGDLVATQYSSKSGFPVITAISQGNHRFPDEAPAMIIKFFREQSRPADPAPGAPAKESR